MPGHWVSASTAAICARPRRSPTFRKAWALISAAGKASKVEQIPLEDAKTQQIQCDKLLSSVFHVTMSAAWNLASSWPDRMPSWDHSWANCTKQNQKDTCNLQPVNSLPWKEMHLESNHLGIFSGLDLCNILYSANISYRPPFGLRKVASRDGSWRSVARPWHCGKWYVHQPFRKIKKIANEFEACWPYEAHSFIVEMQSRFNFSGEPSATESRCQQCRIMLTGSISWHCGDWYDINIMQTLCKSSGTRLNTFKTKKLM